ncbi:MAG: DUF6702 family protein [Pyrinomonadaceae bacterium]
MKKLVLLLLFLLPFTASAHRYHTSLTRMDYNGGEKLAEITIQVFTNDIEDALKQRGGGKQQIHLDKTPKIDELVLSYLAARFVIKNKSGETKKLRWIGLETENDVTLIYVETSMPEGFDGATLENSILNDFFEDQVNLVTTHVNAIKTDLVFRVNDPPQNLVKKEE